MQFDISHCFNLYRMMFTTLPPEKTRRIRTVYNADQKFYKSELDVLHTPILQRLYDLHQLGLTDRVYIDASHTRLSHVVGVMEQASKICAALIRNLTSEPEKQLNYVTLDKTEVSISFREITDLITHHEPALRLMALFHDLTHGPYGHTLEDEIELFTQKHDEPLRQAEAFWSFLHQYIAWSMRSEYGRASFEEILTNLYDQSPPPPLLCKSLERATHGLTLCPEANSPINSPEGKEYIEEFAKYCTLFIQDIDSSTRKITKNTLSVNEFRRLIKDLLFSFTGLLHLEILHKESPSPKHIPTLNQYHFHRFLSAVIQKTNIQVATHDTFDPKRDAFFLDIIGNTICADLLDYAKRDSAHAGLKLDYDPDRIVENFTLVSKHIEYSVRHLSGTDKEMVEALNSESIRAAISIFGTKLRLDVIGELMNLLQIRYYVYERVLFHPTKCIAGALLGRAIHCLGLSEMPQELKYCGDNVFLYTIREAAINIRDKIEGISEKKFDVETIRSLSTSPIEQALIEGLIPDPKKSTRLLECIAFYTTANSGNPLHPNHTDYLKFMNSDAKAITQLRETGTISDKATLEKLSKRASELFPQHRAWLALDKESTTERLNSGLDLLAQLHSRRYPRRVFALLPVSIDSSDNIHLVTPEKIAANFKDPHLRMSVENEIEKRCGLPLGTCVIHCPPASGPTKIAKVLITDSSSKGSESVRLGEIKKLSDEYSQMLHHHQSIVSSLELQYQSIWRLTISFSPPYDIHNKKHKVIIEQVLSEVIGKGINKTIIEENNLIVNELSSDTVEQGKANDGIVESKDVFLREAHSAIIKHPVFINFQAAAYTYQEACEQAPLAVSSIITPPSQDKQQDFDLDNER
ncbi:MAG: hypothetical protein CML13_06950 [Puniceicoccaceae bacterium]|nr:hypothetical protein [Puniceicoccaceae bacterium]